MGGSVGIPLHHPPQTPYDKQFYSLFVDNALVEGEAALRRDQTLRKSFVEYIKGGSWMEKLTRFESPLLGLERDEESPTWTKFGYECPLESPHARSTSVCSNSTQLTGSSSRKSEHPVVSREGRVARATLNECYSAVSGWTLFLGKEELRGVLLAALYPLFLQSSEYKLWRNPSGWRASLESASSDSAESVSFSSQFSSIRVSRKTRKSERLRELLVGTAALFDSTELEACLADPAVSWIQEFKTAITNLPVQLMVCRTNREQKESRVVYSNIKRSYSPQPIPENEELSGRPIPQTDNQQQYQCRNIRVSFGFPGSDKPDSATQQNNAAPNDKQTPPPHRRSLGSIRNVRVGVTAAAEFSDKVGKNLLDLHAGNHSAESLRQMEKALFEAHHFKQRFVRPNGDFHLRAFKPVFSSQGRYLCTLSVDAYGTVDRTAVVDIQFPPEQRFQEVEDVLALLPLFIKA